MNKLTRSNVAHNLDISPHRLDLGYGESNIMYVFSSDLYKRKFLEKLEVNRNSINQSLSNRFGFQIKNDLLSDLRLYTIIEKRGFLIYHNGVKITCQSRVKINGNNITSHGI